jgi:signal transduction histidine kinase/CheY-like chemotaxis protein
MPPALGRRGRVLLAVTCALYCLAVVALIPFAGVALAPLPHASGLYGVTMLILHGLTALLLAFQYRGGAGRAVLMLVAAYVYSAEHALLHTLAYPGAVIPDETVFGNPQTVGWMFLAWHFGFVALVTSAIALELFGGGQHEDRPRKRVLPALLGVTASVAAAYAAAERLPLPTYFLGDRFLMAANVTTTAISLAVVVGLAMLALLPRARSALFLWLAMALLATLGGLVVSTAGGSRYTVGWYAARFSYAFGAAAVLALLLAQITRMQQALVSSVGSLARQAQDLQTEMQKREAAEMMLVQAQKMEVVGRLAGGIAHDFNNFLQVVSLRLDLLHQRLRGQDIEEDMAVIRRGVRRVEALIQHLLSFSGRKRFRPEAILLDAWLAECASFVQATLGARITVHFGGCSEPLAVASNPSELEAAILNLVLNARDALGEGGDITIGAVRRTLAGGNEHGLPPGDYVDITVADNGAGIAPEHLQRVFDPFFTTKPVGQGSGLGLPQVRGFAERQGGAVAIASEPGRGTVVDLLLPALGEQPGAEEATVLATRAGSTILLVDDNQAIQASGRALLEQMGHTVLTAASADEALDILSGRDGGIALVITDVVMPGALDGIGLARTIRATWPALPVVLATGFAVEETGTGFPVLRKPYSLEQLQAAVAASRGTA